MQTSLGEPDAKSSGIDNCQAVDYQYFPADGLFVITSRALGFHKLTASLQLPLHHCKSNERRRMESGAEAKAHSETSLRRHTRPCRAGPNVKHRELHTEGNAERHSGRSTATLRMYRGIGLCTETLVQAWRHWSRYRDIGAGTETLGQVDRHTGRCTVQSTAVLVCNLYRP